MARESILAELDPVQPWDRRAGETPSACAAFQVYLNLPKKQRRALAAYRQYSGNADAKKVPGHFVHWMADNAWRERAVQYDNSLAKQARAEQERLHTRELEAFRQRQIGLSAAAIQLTIKLLQLINAKISDMDAGNISDRQLPSYLRAVAAVAEAATNGEAASLAVEQLLHGLLPG